MYILESTIYSFSFVINNGRGDQETCVRIKFQREKIYIYILENASWNFHFN